MNKKDILKHYSESLLKDDKPSSVHAFCERIGLEEKEFYDHFASLEAIEAGILMSFQQNAIDLTIGAKDQLIQNDSSEPAKVMLLTFYMSYIEILTANRSLVLMLTPKKDIESLNRLRSLKPLKEHFLEFVKGLGVKFTSLDFIPAEQVKNKAIDEAAWLQHISILGFWLKDDSPGFERTDIFIEKSLKFSFDLAQSETLSSLFDLGKFMFKK